MKYKSKNLKYKGIYTNESMQNKENCIRNEV